MSGNGERAVDTRPRGLWQAGSERLTTWTDYRPGCVVPRLEGMLGRLHTASRLARTDPGYSVGNT